MAHFIEVDGSFVNLEHVARVKEFTSAGKRLLRFYAPNNHDLGQLSDNSIDAVKRTMLNMAPRAAT